jgi:photosystem II stability/assembly factor-like uncharacterized protein
MFKNMYRRLIICLLLGLSAPLLYAQPGPTPAESRLNGYKQRQNLQGNSVLKNIEPESIGPSIFSCRVTDLEVDPADPSHFYVAYASGGLWYTESNGTRFSPVFDKQASMTIGDIAVDWQHHVIWVGTGESNSSRSSYAGTGIYRSDDGGKHWEWRGLPESHHIARIVVSPDNPDVLWVAVLGHLYTPNSERGVFKTTDGGKTWRRTLFVDDRTGAVDLVADPVNPGTLYAATWQRERQAWNFSGAGAGSGIWKSIDGGENWSRLNTTESGFPSGEKTGRIGLAAGRKNGRTVLYASIDNQNSKETKPKSKTDALSKDQLKTISVADFLKLPNDKLKDYLRANDFPEQYTARKIKDMVEKGTITPMTLVDYLEDANNNLFETDYIGAEVYRSEDSGTSWKRTHTEPMDVLFFTYGYYFSNIRCQLDNPDQVYLLGFYAVRSDDGGKNWKNISGDNVHADHHALWLNPNRPGHLINGNDGGLNISWDNGASWIKCNNPPVGQFYAITVDNAEPYNLYGGAQDNGIWYGPSNYKASDDWHQSGQYPYKELVGGDGMQVAVDTRDNNTVYGGFQFGNYFKINKKTGKQDFITPKHTLGERPLRFNWQTPIWLSRHNQDVLYIGANKLYRSFDQGENWEAISGDLTTGGLKGNVPYGTLTSVHESPLKFGLLYTGSDDGLIHVTRDGGETWTKISDSLPQKRWVSRVVASSHAKSRVYASLNGYRWDDFSAYVYMSDDYGNHWTRIGTDLPDEPVNVVREDPVNQDLLYVGTDHGLYVSLDRGKSFQAMGSNFPDAPVHDLVIQSKTNDLLVGTHGRSAFRINVSNIQHLNREVLAETIHLFELQTVKYSRNWGRKQAWQAIKDPALTVPFYTDLAGKVNWTVRTKDSLLLNKGVLDCIKGINTFTFALDFNPEALSKYQKALNTINKDQKKPIELTQADSKKYYLYKGTYLFEMEKDGKRVSQEFTIE